MNFPKLFKSFLLKIFLLETILVISIAMIVKSYIDSNSYSLLKIKDQNFLDSVALSQVGGSAMSRDMLLYEYVEENALDSIVFSKQPELENECQLDDSIYICKVSETKYFIYQPLYFDTQKLGYLKISGNVKRKFDENIILIALLAFFLNLILSIIGVNIYVKKPLQASLAKLLNSIQKDGNVVDNEFILSEFSQINSKFRELFKVLKQSENQRIMNKVSYEKIKQNKQIAHDIRSPLEALKSIVGELDGLDYSTKQIVMNSVGRISDIANGLLKSGQGEQKDFQEGNFRILVDDLIGDKQFEYSRKIHYSVSIAYRDTYILGNENSLYRAISNIINNAIEASKKEDKINVSLFKNPDGINLEISDQGEGMSEELLAEVLDGGVTTKEKGNGLGLSYAQKIVEEHRGVFQVRSKKGEGTTVLIILPTIKTPLWFTDQIVVNSNVETIVCVDDDPSFLQLYKEKLQNFNVQTFSEKKIEDALKLTNAQFFFDYDLGKEHSGLDYIIEHNLSSKATLVTSMHQDKDIQARCVENGIKILPKQVFNNAKVVADIATVENENTNLKHVLIDDDELIHMSWKMEAEKQGINFLSFTTIDDFLASSNEIAKDSVIYVDSNLADGIRGEVESEKIAKLGYTEIYLATGYSPGDIDRPEWIKEVVGKRAKFSKS